MKWMIGIILALLLIPIPVLADCYYDIENPIYSGWTQLIIPEDQTFCGYPTGGMTETYGVETVDLGMMYICEDNTLKVFETDCPYPCTAYIWSGTNIISTSTCYRSEHFWYDTMEIDTIATGGYVRELDSQFPEKVAIRFTFYFRDTDCGNDISGNFELPPEWRRTRKNGLACGSPDDPRCPFDAQEWIVQDWQFPVAGSVGFPSDHFAGGCEFTGTTTTSVSWVCRDFIGGIDTFTGQHRCDTLLEPMQSGWGNQGFLAYTHFQHH